VFSSEKERMLMRLVHSADYHKPPSVDPKKPGMIEFRKKDVTLELPSVQVRTYYCCAVVHAGHLSIYLVV
jgi:hypothetical protein